MDWKELLAIEKIWLRERSSYHIEGGDVANLGQGSMMVGISDRTEAAAIDSLARELLWSESICLPGKR